MTDSSPKVEQRRFWRLSAIWIIPLLALGLGVWLIVDSYLSQGPVVQLTVSDAEGINAGETRVKRLSVDLGIVADVYLNPDFEDVTVVLNLDTGTEELLRDDTQFWVVKPRIGTDGVSGLSTLLSGAYIELSPGSGNPGARQFQALDSPPATPVTTPGVRVELISDLDSTINARSPVYYNGFRVGQVESAELSTEDGNTHYSLFINAPYDDLVTTNTRFWNASGLAVEAGVSGVSLRAESLETLLVGGIAFGLPEGVDPGGSIDNGRRYFLYDDVDAINEQQFSFAKPYLLLFDSSIRGLDVGAPVEYRGARLGEVVEVSFDLLERQSGLDAAGQTLVPVLIHIEPGRVFEDNEEGLEEIANIIEEAVPNGLRASLASGNLLTGGLYIELDFHEEVEPRQIRQAEDYDVLPTISSGFTQIQERVSSVLSRLEALPLNDFVSQANEAMQTLTATLTTAEQTMSELSGLLENPSTQSLPANLEESLERLNQVLSGLGPDAALYEDLTGSLDELRGALRNARELTNSLNANPSQLLRSTEVAADPVPGGQ